MLTPDDSAPGCLRTGRASQPGFSAAQSSRAVKAHPSGPPLSLVTEGTSRNLRARKEAKVNLSNIPFSRVS